MKRAAHIQCHTYPSRAALLKQWADEAGISVSSYFRNIIAEHAFRKNGFIEPKYQRPQKAPPKYPRLAGLGYVYLIRCGENYKIGRAVDVLRRVGVMSLPMRPEIISVKCCANYGPLEKELHRKFAASRTYGEWFSFSEEQLSEVKKHFE